MGDLRVSGAKSETAETVESTGPWLVVGLGNPGPRYADNRHNIGAMVISHLADAAQTPLRQHKARAHAAMLRLSPAPGLPGPAAVVAVPMTYMNESGGPVKALSAFFRVPPERVIVVHDELDIEFGAVRLKQGGGEGGHNGLRSVTAALGTKDYLRVRVGVGRPPGQMDAADFVLRDFPRAQRDAAQVLVAQAADAVHEVIKNGLTEAQNVVHAP